MEQPTNAWWLEGVARPLHDRRSGGPSNTQQKRRNEDVKLRVFFSMRAANNDDPDIAAIRTQLGWLENGVLFYSAWAKRLAALAPFVPAKNFMSRQPSAHLSRFLGRRVARAELVAAQLRIDAAGALNDYYQELLDEGAKELQGVGSLASLKEKVREIERLQKRTEAAASSLRSVMEVIDTVDLDEDAHASDRLNRVVFAVAVLSLLFSLGSLAEVVTAGHGPFSWLTVVVGFGIVVALCIASLMKSEEASRIKLGVEEMPIADCNLVITWSAAVVFTHGRMTEANLWLERGRLLSEDIESTLEADYLKVWNSCEEATTSSSIFDKADERKRIGRRMVAIDALESLADQMVRRELPMILFTDVPTPHPMPQCLALEWLLGARFDLGESPHLLGDVVRSINSGLRWLGVGPDARRDVGAACLKAAIVDVDRVLRNQGIHAHLSELSLEALDLELRNNESQTSQALTRVGADTLLPVLSNHLSLRSISQRSEAAY